MLTRLTAAAAMLLLGACVPLSSTPVNDHWIDAWGASFLPTLRVMGGVLETYTLVAMLAVYVLAGLLSQAFVRK